MTGADRDAPAVAVPAVTAPSSVAVLRSLGRRGIHTIAVSEQGTPPAFWSRYCGERVRAPSPSTDLDGYRDVLLELAARNGVRAITPMREEGVYVLAHARERFAEHLPPLWPSASQLEEVHDRERLFATAERIDVPIPETSLLTDVEHWDRERIVKARYALLTAAYTGSVPPGQCDTPPSTIYLEPGVSPDTEGIVDEMGHVPIVQEYLPGPEYSFRALYHDGDPVVTSQKRLLRGMKYPRGPSIYHESTAIPRLEELGRRLLGELDWEGPATVGFIRDDSGAFRLLEINPRFWSNLSMDIQAGVDYPHYYWSLAGGESIDVEADYRPGVASHLLRGELVHLHSVVRDSYPLADRPSIPGTVGNILRSVYEQPNFDYLSRDDPGPFARDVLNTARAVISR